MAGQPAAIAELAETQGDFARLAAMLWASGRAPLTTANEVEILQNASEKLRASNKTHTVVEALRYGQISM